MCYGLIAVGTIALSVRLLSTLGSGDVNCMVLGKLFKLIFFKEKCFKFMKNTYKHLLIQVLEMAQVLIMN